MFAESHRMGLLVFRSVRVQQVQADIVTQTDLEENIRLLKKKQMRMACLDKLAALWFHSSDYIFIFS